MGSIELSVQNFSSLGVVRTVKLDIETSLKMYNLLKCHRKNFVVQATQIRAFWLDGKLAMSATKTKKCH